MTTLHRCYRLAMRCCRRGDQICEELTSMAQISRRRQRGRHLRHGAAGPRRRGKPATSPRPTHRRPTRRTGSGHHGSPPPPSSIGEVAPHTGLDMHDAREETAPPPPSLTVRSGCAGGEARGRGWGQWRLGFRRCPSRPGASGAGLLGVSIKTNHPLILLCTFLILLLNLAQI
jgi:hypothetical protein